MARFLVVCGLDEDWSLEKDVLIEQGERGIIWRWMAEKKLMHECRPDLTQTCFG